MSDNTSVATRIIEILDQLGIGQTHLGAWGSADWGPLISEFPDRFVSMTLPFAALRLGTPDSMRHPILAFASDQGTGPINSARLLERAPHAQLNVFEGYPAPLWNDLIVDHADRIETDMRALFAEHPIDSVDLDGQEGQVGDIRYRAQGNGPPVIVLPIGLVPSQWGPVTAALARDHCVITLRGASLGMVQTLESRAKSGYGEVVDRLLLEAAPQPDSRILEVGCGPGALVRPLAKSRGAAARPITAIDINEYLLDEASALAQAEGVGEAIRFQSANAHDLPFEDNSFDVVFCSTVLEEGNADQMLSEMARVCAPGARVVVAVRAVDIPWWVNVPSDPAIGTRLNQIAPRTSSGAGPEGCADGTLYARVLKAGFGSLRKRLQLAIYADDARTTDVRERLLAMLDGNDAAAATRAIDTAEQEGSFFVAEPFHAAIATK
ncbi:MAG: class I SAM-dependent methyltransferase [Chromatiales bacterium]|jgi:SAM-dependent methyltransferase|nr:class I SAM-dependent methyltransferase [Chromatiales bacterium]